MKKIRLNEKDIANLVKKIIKEEANTDLTVKSSAKKAYQKLTGMGAKVRLNFEGKVIGEPDGNEAHVNMFVKNGELNISIKVNKTMTMEKSIKVLNGLMGDLSDVSSDGARDGNTHSPQTAVIRFFTSTEGQ